MQSYVIVWRLPLQPYAIHVMLYRNPFVDGMASSPLNQTTQNPPSNNGAKNTSHQYFISKHARTHRHTYSNRILNQKCLNPQKLHPLIQLHNPKSSSPHPNPSTLPILPTNRPPPPHKLHAPPQRQPPLEHLQKAIAVLGLGGVARGNDESGRGR